MYIKMFQHHYTCWVKTNCFAETSKSMTSVKIHYELNTKHLYYVTTSGDGDAILNSFCHDCTETERETEINRERNMYM